VDIGANLALGSAQTLTIGGTSANATSADFSTTYGTASANQTFTIGGSSLQGNVTATAGTGFQISSDGTTSGATATFTRNATYAASGTLYARLTASAAAATSYLSATVATLESTNAATLVISTDSVGSSVNQAALTITGLSVANKTYDGTTTATLSGTAAYSGLVLGQSFVVSGTPAATFGNATVGSAKTVTVHIVFVNPAIGLADTAFVKQTHRGLTVTEERFGPVDGAYQTIFDQISRVGFHLFIRIKSRASRPIRIGDRRTQGRHVGGGFAGVSDLPTKTIIRWLRQRQRKSAATTQGSLCSLCHVAKCGVTQGLGAHVSTRILCAAPSARGR
jgi:hypothetical protein